jgi:hypothetical protein
MLPSSGHKKKDVSGTSSSRYVNKPGFHLSFGLLKKKLKTERIGKD